MGNICYDISLFDLINSYYELSLL